jgi:integrase
MLRPYDATIIEACQHYVDHVLRYRTAPPVREIVEKMIADARKANRRPDTIAELRQRLGQFAAIYGDRQLSSISLEEAEQWIDDGHSPRSRINRRRKLGQLFNFAIRRKWTEENFALLVTPPDNDDQEPGILSVEQCARLLEHASEFDLSPYVALGLFSGLRASELERMDWSKVKLGERVITVNASVSKVRSRRNVEINDTLFAWLSPSAKRIGPVLNPVNFLERRRSLAKAAGITDWPHNALRHSFGSYHLAIHNDDTKTAFQMGNSPTIVHRHYKALVTRADAERFWALRPSADAAGKIVPLTVRATG